MSVPRTKLAADERRELILAALDENTNKRGLAAKYNIARSWLYALLDEALTDPQAKLEEARKELEFRQKVAALQPHQAKPEEEGGNG